MLIFLFLSAVLVFLIASWAERDQNRETNQRLEELLDEIRLVELRREKRERSQAGARPGRSAPAAGALRRRPSQGDDEVAPG
jgi:hypothetical protein